MVLARSTYMLLGYLPLNANDYYSWSIVRHLPVFALGILAFHCGMVLLTYRYRLTLGCILLAAGAVVMWALIRARLPDLDPLFWQGVSFSLILMGLLLAPFRLLVNRITRFLGTLSYSLYLVHPTLIYLLIPVYRRVYEQPMALSLKFICCSALTLSLLIPLSYLTYRWIERPGIELGRRLLAAKRAGRARKRTQLSQSLRRTADAPSL
jgi:peptidoglycan/LPS O-acetylase OafA/YrhL